MHAPRVILLLSAALALTQAPSLAFGDALGNVLPAPQCAAGWDMDGKATLYNRDTLFDRIDGEAELYFPYGFDLLAYARYVNRRDPRAAIDADVYRMGSLLDAFGMYANYRRKEAAVGQVGAGGTISSSQLIFYQDRYFVRLQATGTAKPGEDVLLACARAISGKLPGSAARPKELVAFRVPEVVPNSERYLAKSLLGYEFFRRGLIADAVLDGGPAQLFLVPEDSVDAATAAFERYRSYLKASGADIRGAGGPGRKSLEAVDPLYGNVRVEQAGRFLVGAARFRDAAAGRQLVDRLRKAVGPDS